MEPRDKSFQFIVKLEPYALALFCVSLILRVMHIPFSSEVFIIGASTLGMIYMFKSYVKDEKLDTFSFQMRKALLFAIAIGLIGLLFGIQHWPNDKEMMIVFMSSVPVIILICALKNIQLTRILTLTEGIVILGLYFLTLTNYFNLL